MNQKAADLAKDLQVRISSADESIQALQKEIDRRRALLKKLRAERNEHLITAVYVDGWSRKGLSRHLGLSARQISVAVDNVAVEYNPEDDEL